MSDKDGSDREKIRELQAKEMETFERKLNSSILTNKLLAEGATIIKNNDMPLKQVSQLYRAQNPLHNGVDAEYLTLLGQKAKKDANSRLTLNSLAKNAIKHAPTAIGQHWTEEIKKIDDARGSMDAEGFADRLTPYVYKESMTSGFDPKIKDTFTEYCKQVWNKMSVAYNARDTPLSDYETWKSQIKSGTNSGHPLYESLTKDQWTTTYIPQLMNMAREVARTGDIESDSVWAEGIYTLFGRTPNRPVHGVAAFDKMIGAKLNYDLTRGLGGGNFPHMAWMSLETMFQRMAVPMGSVETTVHEDFKWFDSFIGPEIAKCVYDGFVESGFFRNNPENRNILMYLLRQLTSPTFIRISPHSLLKMKAGLYSGTPITQLFGSVVHCAYLELLKNERGVGITDYCVLSDDGMCTVEGDKAAGVKMIETEFVGLASEIGMKISPEKSYVADIREKKVMFSPAGGDAIIRHDVGPFLQKYIQTDDPLGNSFGNVPRLIASLKGRERDFERESHELLVSLLPGLRQANKGDRSTLVAWVPDMHRTLEVLAQVRPGYPRVRELVRGVVNVYPNFWNRYDRLVTAAEATGGALFDTATPRPGGTSDKGTMRWLVEYLGEWRSTGSLPQVPSSVL